MASSGAGLVDWGREQLLLGLLCACLLSLVVVIVLLVAILRRRDDKEDIDSIVVAVEDIRSGRHLRKVPVAAKSRMALVADVVHRLGQDFMALKKESGKSAAMFHAISEADPECALIATDADGCIRTYGPAAGALFGWSEREILGCQFSILFEEEAWKDFLPRLSRKGLDDHGLRFQGRLIRKDRSSFDAEMSIRTMQSVSGDRAGYAAVIRDITRQSDLMRKLSASEKRYRSLVDDLVEGVVILGEGRILFANNAMADLLGRSVATLIDENFQDFILTRDLLLVKEELESLMSEPTGGGEFRFSVVSQDDGLESMVRMRGTRIEYAGKQAVLGVVSDETIEKRAETALKRNESCLDAVLEATTDGVLVLIGTADGRIVHLTNQAFLDMFGFGRDEILGLPEAGLRTRLSERHGEGCVVADCIAAAGDGGRRETIMLEGENRREVAVSTSPLTDRNGCIHGKILVCRDLRDQRESRLKMEGQVRELSEELERVQEAFGELGLTKEKLVERTADLDRLNLELRKLNGMKSNLLANVSHELQTPLVSIRGYTEMILKERLGDITEEQRKGLELCLRNIDRLISMIDGLMEYSRMERETAGLELSTFSLKELIDECGESSRPGIEERTIEWVVQQEDPGIIVHADRAKIRQVFDNLITNAIKYNRDGGRIEIHARAKSSDFAVVMVRDTGMGVPQDELGRIFERFYQVEGSNGKEIGGSGLGLSIVMNILRLHGCTIHAESKEGEGTTFTFTLPLAEAAEETDDGSTQAAPEPDGTPGEKTSTGTDRTEGLEKRPRLRIIRP